jgi:hypothetical protein
MVTIESPTEQDKNKKISIFSSFFEFFSNNGYDEVFWPTFFDKKKEKNYSCERTKRCVTLIRLFLVCKKGICVIYY